MASGRPEDAAAAALETVSYAQMLVLFAPQAVPATAHLPLLLDTLPSRQPTLRRQVPQTAPAIGHLPCQPDLRR